MVIQSDRADANAEKGARQVTWLAIAESDADALERVAGTARTVIERGAHVLEEARAQGVPEGRAKLIE